jgi:hypothetical protein
MATNPPPWTSLRQGDLVLAPFGGPGNQYILGVVAYGNGFVAIGEDFQSDKDVDGAIWTSPDGTAWGRLNLPGNDLAASAMDLLATDGRRLVAIGTQREAGQIPDRRGVLWTSDDGTLWKRYSDPAPFGDAEIRGLTASATGFAAWGAIDGDAAAFFSADGTTWARTALELSDARTQISDIEPFRGGFVAVGGHRPADKLGVGGPDRSTATAWWSPDGRTWDTAVTDQGFGLGNVVVGAAGLLAIGGSGRGGISPEVIWHSTDGRRWQRVGDDIPNWPLYASDGARIVRYDWQGSGAVEESTDGITWQQVGSTGRQDVNGVAVGPHGILLIESMSAGQSRGVGGEVDGGVRFLAAG